MDSNLASVLIIAIVFGFFGLCIWVFLKLVNEN